MVKRS